MNHLEGMFVGCQKSFIAAPTFDEREATRFARRVCQSIDDILNQTEKNTFRKMLELIFFSSKIRHTRQNKKTKNRSTNLASCPVANAAHDALDTFHPNFQFHGG